MSRRKRESIEDYERLIRAGFGSGEGINYKPWLRVRDVPSRGVSAKIRSMTVGRRHETLSGLESNSLILADFNNDVIDIREQFPLFPLDAVCQLASNAGIRYPRAPNSTAPAILTTDLLLTRRTAGDTTYQAISIKPSSELRKRRVLEKLEIERLWWQSLDVDWKLVTELNIPVIVADNLAWVSKDLRSEEELFSANDLPSVEALVHTVESGIYTVESLFKNVSEKLSCDPEQAGYAILRAIWMNQLQIDLGSSIEESGLINVVGWDKNILDGEQEITNERSA